MHSLLAVVDPYIAQFSYGALFGVLFAESFGLPLPGETFLVAASFLAAQGQLNGIVAGSATIGWHRFVLYNALGGLIWVGAWSTGVYVFGNQITVWLLRLHTAERLLAGVLALTLLAAGAYWGIAKRSHSRR